MAIKYPVIELFSGIGGLSHGFRQEKFKVIGGFDIDVSCKYAFEENNQAPFFAEDLNLISSNKINGLYPANSTRILVGCAPCQAFSTYAQKDKNNDKWKMLYAYSRIIDEIKPEIISMENVPNLKNYQGGKVLNDFLDILKKNKYYFDWQIVDSSEYGVPQSRKRLILLASKLGEIKLIPPKKNAKKVTVRDAIGFLPAISDGETSEIDSLHRARKLSQKNKQRIVATPYGGGWNDWPEELLLECHKKETGKSFGSVYGRMTWDDLAPTMTTQCCGLGNGRFGHPDQDRAISLREAALLQTFPATYKFVDPENEYAISKTEMHIGNAVPVALGRVIAKSIKKHLKKYGNK